MIEVLAFDCRDIARNIDEVADVYEAAYAERGFTRMSFLSWFNRHRERYPLDFSVACDRHHIIGWMYSFRLPPDAPWWDHFQGELPAGLAQATASWRVHVFAELVVLPPYRRRGIARQLYQAVSGRWTEADFAALAVLVDNEVARRAYLRWGWYRIGDIQSPDGACFEAMVLEL